MPAKTDIQWMWDKYNRLDDIKANQKLQEKQFAAELNNQWLQKVAKAEARDVFDRKFDARGTEGDHG